MRTLQRQLQQFDVAGFRLDEDVEILGRAGQPVQVQRDRADDGVVHAARLQGGENPLEDLEVHRCAHCTPADRQGPGGGGLTPAGQLRPLGVLRWRFPCIPEVPVRATLLRGFIIATLSGVAACGDSPPPLPPTAPTPQPQPPVSLLRTSLTPGEVSFTGTGQSVRLVVTAIFSDGTTRDITSDVNWRIDHPDVVSIDGGLLTVRGYGTATFSSEYQGRVVGPGYAFVRVPAELLVPLTGVVRDQYNRPVPDAQIVGTGAIDLGGVTDANGAFDLGTTYGPVRLTLTKFGHETREVDLQVSAPVRALLAMPESPSPYVEHVVEADGAIPRQHRIETRAGGPLDVLVEALACDYRRVVGVLTVRLHAGGVPLGDEVVGCRARVRQIVPGDEAQLDVAISTPGTYRVTYRLPR